MTLTHTECHALRDLVEELIAVPVLVGVVPVASRVRVGVAR